MVRKFLSVATVMVGVLAWVAKAHASDLWGYMLYSESNGYGCMSCDPVTPPVSMIKERPYDVYVQDLVTHEWAAWENGRLSYIRFTNGWAYQIVDSNFLQVGHDYMILLQRNSSSAGRCAMDICPYYVTYNGEEIRFDVKMYSEPDENPLGGDSLAPNWQFFGGNLWDNIKTDISLRWDGKRVLLYASTEQAVEIEVISLAGKLLWKGRQVVKVGKNEINIPYKGKKGLAVVLVQTPKGDKDKIIIPIR